LLQLIETGRLNHETLSELERQQATLHPEYQRTNQT
jgi:hypothetical protein